MVSLFMIIAALMEFAVVLVMKHHPRNTKIHPEKDDLGECPDDRKSWIEMDCKMKCQSMEKKEELVINDVSQKKPLYKKLDHACFLLFPIIYVLFNSIYFSFYGII